MALTLDGDNGVSGVNGSAGTPALQGTDTNTGISFGTDTVNLVTGGSNRATVDSSGRLLVGVTSGSHPLSVVNSQSSKIQFGQASDQGGFLFSDAAGGFGISGGGYYNGSNWIAKSTSSSHIRDDGDGNIKIFTNASLTAGSTFTPTERMRITPSGQMFLNDIANSLTVSGFTCQTPNDDFYASFTNTATVSGRRVLQVRRQGSDGDLIQFVHADTLEGTISVNGTTVTYGGGHLARWSQLPNEEDPSSILKGTVLSNLDEMCEWAYDAEPEVLWAEGDELPEGVNVGDVKTPAKAAGTEDNEQLNRMKVSDVEGDPNVAGVFVSTSPSEDGPLDFFCAMTGDMIIRIAQGVTVQRGDLLMSAGDGTAKPQDDDIIRSKTIAKVTSTNVSCTYADGSFCVPCVLMAC